MKYKDPEVRMLLQLEQIKIKLRRKSRYEIQIF